ncbi:hypothetical protein [Luteibacter sp. SG786]|uniref:hypothetical protein n=1 Tax=Luteibacter sp. SG786 TaxID=2587130 RepID=UPI00141EDE1C|nr:hypothetical protein [Luteibacter sp. SG786]NII54260.1 hypothetical protein [Luteibacter sp. SG786]
MTTIKPKFPVPDFPIRGGVLKQTQRNALVRSALASAMTSKAAGKKSAASLVVPAKLRKGK